MASFHSVPMIPSICGSGIAVALIAAKSTPAGMGIGVGDGAEVGVEVGVGVE